MTTRRTALAALAVAGLFTAMQVATAEAYTRSGSTTGAKGRTVSSSGSGSCVAGAGCSSTGKYTGPAGNSVNRNSKSSCTGGVCTRSSTYSR
jgi:hypothetical protein